MTDSQLWSLANLTPGAPGLLHRPASSGLGSLGGLISPTATIGSRGIADMLLSPSPLNGQGSWQPSQVRTLPVIFTPGDVYNSMFLRKLRLFARTAP